ncbi:MBL fold metallo-hydrolase [Patescibacteria group bacterium]|jgi:L-ascorbate metabolism protein UlaG (beta-lactamase superfamily)|nr:MBL fold metallo-hydrolase [Patescibacteria group bacterium]
MNRTQGTAVVIVLVLIALASLGLYLYVTSGAEQENTAEVLETAEPEEVATTTPVAVTPISHATLHLAWSGTGMLVDPVGDPAQYAALGPLDVLLLSDTDPDHLDPATIAAVATDETALIAPAAVIAELPEDLASRAQQMDNGDTLTLGPFTLTAVPMYNRTDAGEEPRHPKGRGNGYVIDDGSYRVYLAGDTDDTPELRGQTDIDLAFVPMNPPYTMNVDAAAAGVLAFRPAVVVPYHFRTPEGFSDVGEFKSLVEDADPQIEVRLLDFYPETQEDGVPRSD